jgi:hypothetical protein
MQIVSCLAAHIRGLQISEMLRGSLVAWYPGMHILMLAIRYHVLRCLAFSRAALCEWLGQPTQGMSETHSSPPLKSPTPRFTIIILPSLYPIDMAAISQFFFFSSQRL